MTPLLAIAMAIALVSVAIVLFRFRSDTKHRLLNEQITNEMPSGIININNYGVIVGHNRASERIFERPLTSARFCEMVQESARLESLLNRCLTEGEVFTRVEFNIPISPFNDKRIGVNLSPITNVDGEIDGAICLLSDLTEITELQNQVKLRENFAVLGEMSAGIAHEFKNSIATILGYAQLSIREDNTEVIKDYVREIQKESQSLSNMVTDFLNFARPMTPTIHPVDLSELMESVIADVRNSRPGPYRIALKAENHVAMQCDATLMRQAMMNLLLNAVEAVAAQDGVGRISVALERTWERESSIVRITIEDNGRGIPAHEIAKIFYPFFTTKSHGTGLGLSLVQKIVIAHNGRIEVQNGDSRGVRFVVTLPVRE